MLVTGADSLTNRVRKIPDLLARIPYRWVILIGVLLSAAMSVAVFLLFKDWRVAILTWVGVMLAVTFLEATTRRRARSHTRRRLGGSSTVGSVLSRYDFPERGTVGLMMTSRILDSYERIIHHPVVGSLVEVDTYSLNKSVWEAAVKGHGIAVIESQHTKTYGIDAATLEDVSDPESYDLTDLGTFASQMTSTLESLDRAEKAYATNINSDNTKVVVRVVEPIDDSTLWSVIQRAEAIVLMNSEVSKRADL